MGLFGSSDPEFLADGAIYGKVRELITDAQESLVIVSPYVDLPDDFVREVERAANRCARVELIFRRDKQGEYRQAEWYRRFLEAGVGLATVERLHSKLYLNESHILLTSMNFHRSSGENSFEVGVLFESDHRTAKDANKYLGELRPHLEEVTGSFRRKNTARGGRPSEHGFCIRCADPIPLNLKRPYCGADYEKWAKYKNPDFEDRYCHVCGTEYPATMSRPRCDNCYRRAA